MPLGYCNKILHVNLTTGTLEIEEPGEAFYRKYLGGTALGLHYLLKEMPAGADALGPDNVMVISVGVLTGAPLPGVSRLGVNAKSPLTGGIGDSQAGGFWPAELKFAGFDAIVIKGQSCKPVYLWVHNGEAELRDAAHLWGKETGPTEDLICEELGDRKVQVLGIGPSGEKLVKYAALITMKSRAAGRTGMGAVMGSKNLKAVAVRGTHKAEVADKAALGVLSREAAQFIDDNLATANFGKYGTAGSIAFQNKSGNFPTRNWTSGAFEHWEKLCGETMADTILKKRETCFVCMLRCKRVVEVEGPIAVDPQYGGPEYETLATFGSYCEISDLVAVSKANEICNRYGLDTITAGACIAFAMDCFENGVLTLEDTGGLDLRFGNAEAMLTLVEQIAKREGFGALLAEGSDAAAAEIGRGAERFSVCCKGSPFPAHVPQFKRSMALTFAVNPYGADHQSSEHDHNYTPLSSEERKRRISALGLISQRPAEVLDTEKVRFALYTQYEYQLMNCVIACHFMWGATWQVCSITQMERALRAVTGWDASLFEMMKVGERSLNMMRVFNAREGFDRSRDTLPPKAFQPLKGGPNDGVFVTHEEFERAREHYYAMAGFDEQGVPNRGKLEELDLGWAADLLGK